MTNKTVFVRIDYDDKYMTGDNIENNLNTVLRQSPEKIETKFFKGLNNEQADYVQYAIEDNPI